MNFPLKKVLNNSVTPFRMTLGQCCDIIHTIYVDNPEYSSCYEVGLDTHAEAQVEGKEESKKRYEVFFDKLHTKFHRKRSHQCCVVKTFQS